MALTTCADCQAQVSEAASACPRCGRPLSIGSAAPALAGASSASRRGRSALAGTGVGFLVGFALIWAGCSHFAEMKTSEVVLAAIAGALFAILGAILGAVLGGARHRPAGG
jgi:hypothetical protein